MLRKSAKRKEYQAMRETTNAKPQPRFSTLSLRHETRAKFERIRVAKRWTLSETADAIADAFIARELSTSPPEAVGAGR
jgi:hypothetical protein